MLLTGKNVFKCATEAKKCYKAQIEALLAKDFSHYDLLIGNTGTPTEGIGGAWSLAGDKPYSLFHLLPGLPVCASSIENSEETLKLLVRTDRTDNREVLNKALAMKSKVLTLSNSRPCLSLQTNHVTVSNPTRAHLEEYMRRQLAARGWA